MMTAYPTKQTVPPAEAPMGANWVNMSEEDGMFFQEITPFRPTVSVMLYSGVFTPPTNHASQVILHYNAQGQLAKIDRNQILFVLTAK